MRAILIATGFHIALQPIVYYQPSPLLRIVDKPIIVHIIEFLSRHGILQIDVVLSHLPEMIESTLEAGRRWGVHITYHLAKDADHPYEVLIPAVQGWKDELVLLGRADALPDLPTALFQETPSAIPRLFYYPSNVWTGWCLLPAAILGGLPSKISEEVFLKEVEAKIHDTVISLPFLSTRSLREGIESNLQFLNQKPSGFLFPTTARMWEKGVWISHAARVHFSAKIVPPVFIGEYTQIGKGVQIGPYAIIQNHCYIGNDSVVKNSLVCQCSYVGEGLALENSIVDRNMMINLELDAYAIVKDDFILGELKTRGFELFIAKHARRCLAGCLLALLSPLFLGMLPFYKLSRKQVLRLPTSQERYMWQTFDWLSFVPKRNAPSYNAAIGAANCSDNGLVERVLRFLLALPVLINILRGEVHFVGVPPRTPSEVEALPSDWKNIYLKSKVGWVVLADLEATRNPSQDELYMAEAYYTARISLSYDIKLFFLWLKKMIWRG